MPGCRRWTTVNWRGMDGRGVILGIWINAFEVPKISPDVLRVDEQDIHLARLLGEVEAVWAVGW